MRATRAEPAECMDTQIPSQTSAKPQLIAPAWHTAALISLMLALSWWGAHRQSFSPVAVSPRPHGHIFPYTFMIIMEWLMIAFAWYGLRLKKVSFRELLGSERISAKSLFRDLGIAILFLIGSDTILGIIVIILHATRNEAVQRIVPQKTTLEIALYLLLALSAGICEEIMFRGYLQKQLFRLFGNESLAVLLQGIVFGAAHGYQGIKFMFALGVYGCLFGLLVRWRNSLYPGMMTHALQDSFAGLLAKHAKAAIWLIR